MHVCKLQQCTLLAPLFANPTPKGAGVNGNNNDHHINWRAVGHFFFGSPIRRLLTGVGILIVLFTRLVPIIANDIYSKILWPAIGLAIGVALLMWILRVGIFGRRGRPH
jgi:hypothetical protein